VAGWENPDCCFFHIAICAIGIIIANDPCGQPLPLTHVSIITTGWFSNRLVLVGIAIELVLAWLIIYTPFGNDIFGCAPIGPHLWLLLAPFALLLLGADETRKYFVRHSGHRVGQLHQ
jgi:magnesium-transporting ATPase (P-type)